MRVRGKTVLDRNKQSQANICIVTRSLDCDDLFNEPSLSMTALAQRLALAGYPITLLWIPRNPPDEKKTREFQEYYRSRYGIEVEKFKHSDQLIWQFSNAQYFSFGAWSYIRPQNFSDVFFPLEEGLAYYSLLAKETGVFEPASANIHVVASVPIEWCSQADRFFFRSMEQIRNSFMEKVLRGASRPAHLPLDGPVSMDDIKGLGNKRGVIVSASFACSARLGG